MPFWACLAWGSQTRNIINIMCYIYVEKYMLNHYFSTCLRSKGCDNGAAVWRWWWWWWWWWWLWQDEAVSEARDYSFGCPAGCVSLITCDVYDCVSLLVTEGVRQPSAACMYYLVIIIIFWHLLWNYTWCSWTIHMRGAADAHYRRNTTVLWTCKWREHNIMWGSEHLPSSTYTSLHLHTPPSSTIHLPSLPLTSPHYHSPPLPTTHLPSLPLTSPHYHSPTHHLSGHVLC